MMDQLIGGLALGGVYALIALGYTMVYGIIELINFAHGEVMMLGVFYIYAFSVAVDPSIALGLGLFTSLTSACAFDVPLRRRFGRPGIVLTLVLAVLIGHMVKMLSLAATPVWAAVPVGIVCAGITGAALERVAYRPLRNAPRLAPLISAIGASLFFQNVAQLVFGTHRYSLPLAEDLSGLRVAGMPATSALIITVAVVTMIALHLFITRTRTGTAMRATAQDRTAASLMGVDIDSVIALTFVIGSTLAAVGGLLFTIHQKSLWPYMGFMAGIKAFTAAVLGGIGNIPGAMLGGLLLGVIESVGAGMLADAGFDAGYKDAIAFCILIIVLLVRPTGILGKKSVVKV